MVFLLVYITGSQKCLEDDEQEPWLFPFLGNGSLCLWRVSSQCTLSVWRVLPRRYYTNTAFPYFDDIADINVVITHFCSYAAGAAQLVFLYNFIHSIFYGKKAEQNPWRSNTMEWTTPVEHMHGNWPGAIPEVHRWAYDYSKAWTRRRLWSLKLFR